MKENNPSVSFIIPYYNAGETIQQTIDSIFNQDYDNFDIWIVNDGSTDQQSIDKLKDFEGNFKIKILHQQNTGPSIARNNAIKQSNANFIIPIDSDDKILSYAISKSLAFFQEDSKIGVVYGDIKHFGLKNQIKFQQEFDIKRQLLWNQVALCTIIKKEVFDAVGYFDEELSKPGLEDWEFWIRVYERGWYFKKVDELLFEVRASQQSRTYQVANKNLTEIKRYVYQKHADILAREYERLYYDRKMFSETPDYKIGNLLLKPYRFIKSIFN
jgi:glycosyltransferase involved in cell wall biosynthesis